MPSISQYLSYLNQQNVKAFLDTIAWAEGGTYNKLYGGGTFSGNQHPNRKITAGGYASTAAGRYQFLYSTWIGIKNKLDLSDFSPTNQDIAALELINQRGALSYVLSGDLLGALKTLGCAWAALPYSGCGQKERSLTSVQNYYNARAGNKVVNTASATPVITEKDVAAALNPNLQAADNSASNIMIAVAVSIFILGVVISRR